MKKKNMKWKKLESIENMEGGYNTQCIKRAMEMNMTNKQLKQGDHMQEKQQKTTGQGV